MSAPRTRSISEETQSVSEVNKLWALINDQRREIARLTDLLVSRNLQELNALRTKPETDHDPDPYYKTDETYNEEWENQLRAHGLSEDEIELARVSD